MGSLAFTSTPLSNDTTSRDLTALGGTDWNLWYGFTNSPTNDKSGGSGISDLTQVGSGSGDTLGGTRTCSYTDGTSPTSGSTTTSRRLIISGTGNGWSFTFTADTTSRKAYVFPVPRGCTVQLTASLSDASATDISHTFDAAPGFTQQPAYAEIDYQANSAGQTLTVTLVATAISSGSAVGIQGAALDVNAASSFKPSWAVNANTVIG